MAVVTAVTEYPDGKRVLVPVTVGRRYGFLDVASGRADLGTAAARSETMELRPIPVEMVERDLGRSDLDGIGEMIVDALGGRVVHAARWADGSLNVLVETGPDVDASGRAW